jgi:broad specificity phosphatase PhoE
VKIICLRHAESEGNLNKDIYLTKNDWEIELTEKGKKDCETFRENNIGLIFDVAYYSSYKRVSDTAKIAFMDKFHSFIEEPLLAERNWGDRNIRDFNFFFKPTGLYGESFFEFYQRVFMFYNYLKLNHAEDTVLLVTHSEWIKMFDKIFNKLTIEEFQERNKIWKIKNLDYVFFQFGKLKI